MEGFPKIGVALGGGFLRGAAHIGVLKVLEAEGIPVNMLAGCSSGSIVASLFAAGYTADEVQELVVALEPQDVFDGWNMFINMSLLTFGTFFEKLSVPFPFNIPAGVFKGKRLERTVKYMMGRANYFSQLKSKCLAITAVDVRNGSQIIFMPGGFEIKEVRRLTVIPPKDVEVINDVPISEAVRASCSVPGLFEPKKIGKRVLVDGGIRDNIPVEILEKTGMDIVIGVDVGYDGHVVHEVNTITQVLAQSLDIMGSENTLIKLDEYADLVIRPEIKDVAIWDFERIKYCIEQGEKKTKEMLPEIYKIMYYKEGVKKRAATFK